MMAASTKEKKLQNEEYISGHTVSQCDIERSKLSAEEAASKIMNEWNIFRLLSNQMNTCSETQHRGLG
jgi:hypothetical protein